MFPSNDASLKTAIAVPENSDFPIQNLPYGIFSTADRSPRPCTRVGNTVVDLQKVAELGYFDAINTDRAPFSQPVLNDFMDLGKAKTRQVRERLSELLREGGDLEKHFSEVCVPLEKATLHLPVRIGDYTDFYSSQEHATNVGKMFRPDGDPLLPNWKHLPVGYHGRASSIIVSGTPVHRPMGQIKPNPDEPPVFGASRLMDFELETAFVTCGKTELGDRITTDAAEDHIFGLLLFNDWSARDIQKWEYVPLGPFLGKSFGSSVSPWIITLEALEPFRVASPAQDVPILPYLQCKGNHTFDIELEVLVNDHRICQSNYKYLYWNMVQQLVHQTVNGCNLNTGDLYASGTISGSTPDSYGSLLELTWRGSKPIPMPDGSEMKFLRDHDTVTMRGFAQNETLRIGFGEVSTQLLPVKP
ncbi:MAG: fumarylacetoacetase [Bacteroidota bacterium]